MATCGTAKASHKKVMGDTWGETSDNGHQTAEITIQARWSVLESFKSVESSKIANGLAIMLSPVDQGGQAEAVTTVDSSTNGEMLMSTEYSRYWYLCGVCVGIWCHDDSPVHLVADSPGTTEYTHHKSSTISGSAGTFNGDPTTNGSFSNSFSTDLKDFGIENATDKSAGELKHAYYFAAFDGGEMKTDGNFLNWADLWSKSDEDLIHQCCQPLTYGYASNYAPPQLCYSNFPIFSQGIWTVDKSYTGKSTFYIDVRGVWAGIHSNAIKDYAKVHKHLTRAEFTVDWSGIEGQGASG